MGAVRDDAEHGPVKLGRYELIASIGAGGMADVQLALQRGPAGFEKLVVVKLVHEHLASEKALVEMLLDEARLAAKIKHPNVVDIYELGEDGGRYFIAMEYLEGEPLLALLRAGRDGRRLDPLSTARVVADTAEGLDAAHRLKALDGTPLELVHHDVSLANIMVLYSGQVKLVDFGVAKASRSTPAGDRVHGKLGYMAPEKLAAAAAGDAAGAGDRRGDIWSLGCVLWEALTLRRLFDGDGHAETIRRVLEEPIAAPSAIDPAVPAELDAIALRALERDPERRYQTARAMAADLEDVLRERRYGARNDAIREYMEATFAAHIAARADLLREVSGEARPSAAVIEAAFGGARETTSSYSGSLVPVAQPPPVPAPASTASAPTPTGPRPPRPRRPRQRRGRRAGHARHARPARRATRSAAARRSRWWSCSAWCARAAAATRPPPCRRSRRRQRRSSRRTSRSSRRSSCRSNRRPRCPTSRPSSPPSPSPPARSRWRPTIRARGRARARPRRPSSSWPPRWTRCGAATTAPRSAP